MIAEKQIMHQRSDLDPRRSDGLLDFVAFLKCRVHTFRPGIVAGLTALLYVLLMGPALAAPPAQTPTESPKGVISGRVQMASTNLPVVSAPVRLRHWSAEAELSPLTTSADAQGQFRFDGLDAGTHAFYRAETDYQGVTFRSGFIAFEGDITQTVASLNVYETTDQPDAVTVQRFHFIIMAREKGTLSVMELYQFVNGGERAYVGKVDSDGQRETVRIALPPDAQDLVLQAGTLGVDFLSRQAELVATAPVLPGKETFDVAFLYVIPYATPSVTLDRVLHYDTAEVNGLLMDMGVDMQSNALTFVGERAAQGQTFLQFAGQDFKAGQALPISLNGLDNMRLAGAAQAPGDAVPPPPGGVEHTTLLWVMLGLGGLLVVFVAVYPSVRARFDGMAVPVQADPEAEQQRLLLTLARLDEAYAAGQMSEAVYSRARAHRKAELAELWRRGRDQA